MRRETSAVLLVPFSISLLISACSSDERSASGGTGNAELIVAKMQGIRVKNVALEPALATDAHRAEPQD